MNGFYQGLDSLCGIYSIINAYQYLNDASPEECQLLFDDIIKYLSKKRMLKDAILSGVWKKNISMIMRDVLGDRIKNKTLIWAGQPNPTTRVYWNSVVEFLEVPKSCVIIGIGGKYDHFTVGISATQKTIKLLDSDGLKFLRYKECSTDLGKDIVLYPAQTFYLR
jgi:hypothetical protein